MPPSYRSWDGIHDLDQISRSGFVARQRLGVAALKPGHASRDDDQIAKETILGVEIPQLYARYVAVRQPVEVTFKIFSGATHTGRVETALQATATGQTQVGGLAVAPKEVESAPFVIRFKLDNESLARRLPAGSTGLAAITDRVNNITGRKGADGSLAIQFGGCDGKIPKLPADHERLEPRRAALSPARRDPGRCVEFSGAAGGELSSAQFLRWAGSLGARLSSA